MPLKKKKLPSASQKTTKEAKKSSPVELQNPEDRELQNPSLPSCSLLSEIPVHIETNDAIPKVSDTCLRQNDLDFRETSYRQFRQNMYRAWKEVHERNSIVAKILSFLGICFIGWLAMLTVGKISDFKVTLDLKGWLPAVLQTVGIEAKKTNILITGIGGVTNDAPYLTDTIILASIDPQKDLVSLLSIPRDLYVKNETVGNGKINSLYAKGRYRFDADRGARILMEKVTEITGEPVDAYVMADFQGFTKVVDILGGIDVDVPEPITDREYPDGNWGYKTFSIAAGLHHLDGDTALMYARSRHSTSDFDRSLRQQLILQALREKGKDILKSPSKIRGILSALSSNVTTSLSLPEIIALGGAVAGKKKFQIASANLNDYCFQNGPCAPGAFLYPGNREQFGGESVMIPTGTEYKTLSPYEKIKKFAYVVFHFPEVLVSQDLIQVVNTTKQTGIAAKTSAFLRRNGLPVASENGKLNASGNPLKQTIIRFRPDLEKGPLLEALGLFIFSPQVAWMSATDTLSGSTQEATTEDGEKLRSINLPEDPTIGVQILLGEDAKLFLE